MSALRSALNAKVCHYGIAPFYYMEYNRELSSMQQQAARRASLYIIRTQLYYESRRIAKMKYQISDSIPCGIILAISGGCMDAYSYLFRGHVFANAQTGNLLLFGVHLAGRDFVTASRYMWPILSFAAGIILSDMINAGKHYKRIHWRQLTVLIEALILAAVAFLPESANAVANAMTSFACGIQVESFRSIRGNSIATTMCIGNAIFKATFRRSWWPLP